MKGVYLREFLNQPGYHAGAHVIVDLAGDGSGEVRIADCNKTISLSINGAGEHNSLSDLDNSILKLETLHVALGLALRHVRKAYRNATR